MERNVCFSLNASESSASLLKVGLINIHDTLLANSNDDVVAQGLLGSTTLWQVKNNFFIIFIYSLQ
jgi:hypothetical protein